MFKSGKITSVGTKSEKEGKNNLKESAFDLGNVLKTKIHATKIKTVNVFAVSDIDQNIDLKKIVKKIEINIVILL